MLLARAHCQTVFNHDRGEAPAIWVKAREKAAALE
jgi:hypothetical protein